MLVTEIQNCFNDKMLNNTDTDRDHKSLYSWLYSFRSSSESEGNNELTLTWTFTERHKESFVHTDKSTVLHQALQLYLNCRGTHPAQHMHTNIHVCMAAAFLK